VSISSTIYFGLFVSGVTISMIYGIFGVTSATFMRSLCCIYFFIASSFTFLFTATRFAAILSVHVILNSVFLVFYVFSQIPKLKKSNSDIWSYGILFLILGFHGLTLFHTFAFGDVVGELSEHNIDNFFLTTLYTFIMTLMIHKFWLSTCDFELECLALGA